MGCLFYGSEEFFTGILGGYQFFIEFVADILVDYQLFTEFVTGILRSSSSMGWGEREWGGGGVLGFEEVRSSLLVSGGITSSSQTLSLAFWGLVLH